jgi:hypothetical protein
MLIIQKLGPEARSAYRNMLKNPSLKWRDFLPRIQAASSSLPWSDRSRAPSLTGRDCAIHPPKSLTHNSHSSSKHKARQSPPFHTWALISGLAISHLHRNTVHAAPSEPLRFSATKNWSFPAPIGGASHTISAGVQGKAKLSIDTGKVECIFTLNVSMSVAGLPGTYPVEQSGKIGFIGRDQFGNVLWSTPKGSYSPGTDLCEVFSVDKELLLKTVQIDVMFEMTRPRLTQQVN